MDVSVIIPVYQAGDHISRCVHSCLAQVQVKEIILIEDGSTDCSLTTCTQLANDHAKITLLTHLDHKNKGVAASRNLGLNHASCSYVAFLDADDIYLPNRFEISEKLFSSNQDLDGVYEAIERIDNSNNGLKEYIFFAPKNRSINLTEEYLFGEAGWFSLAGLVLHRSVARKMCFDENLPTSEDTDFILNLFNANYNLAAGSKVAVARSYRHGHNITSNQQLVEQGRYFLFKKWLDKTPFLYFSFQGQIRLIREYLHSTYVWKYKNYKRSNIIKFYFYLKTLIANPRIISFLFTKYR